MIKTSTQERTTINPQPREPWGYMLDMMSAVQGLWEERDWITVTPAAHRVAEYPSNRRILKAEGWTQADFVATCELLMGKPLQEVWAICKERGWKVPNYA